MFDIPFAQSEEYRERMTNFRLGLLTSLQNDPDIRGNDALSHASSNIPSSLPSEPHQWAPVVESPPDNITILSETSKSAMDMYAALRAVVQKRPMLMNIVEDFSKVCLQSITTMVWNQAKPAYTRHIIRVTTILEPFGKSCNAIARAGDSGSWSTRLSLPPLYRDITDLTITFGHTDMRGVSVCHTSDNLATVKDSELPAFYNQFGSVENFKVTLMLAVSSLLSTLIFRATHSVDTVSTVAWLHSCLH